MGRTGKVFAFEHFGVVPHAITLGKALGGGMPIGCLVSSRENMRELSHNPFLGHISTFAGHPVACAAAHAFLEQIHDEELLNHAESIGQFIEEKLSQHPNVIEIRRKGLFFAIDMESAEVVQQVVEENLRNGLLSFWFLSCPWSFRIAPPLTITMEEAAEGVAIILKSMDDTTSL
jgi:acetylornithine/succinyldiaminopimelate/putrescine aminotransferase